MNLKFQVQAKIRKPVSEVFESVYNPKKLSGYFTTSGASGPLDEGKEVVWKFHDFPKPVVIQVKRVIKGEKIMFDWANSEGGKTRVVVNFEALDKRSTLVKITESGWKNETKKSLDESYSHCMGWTQMLCCLKIFVEDGKNLREFFF